MGRKKVLKRALVPRDLFALAPNVIKEPKYFPISLDTILEKLAKRERVDIESESETADSGHQKQIVTLRLTVTGIPRYPDGWHVSLLLYNKRIDGFGYEHRFRDLNGLLRKGWHRHTWNPKTQDADGKVPVRLFRRSDMTLRNFLIRTFKAMKIGYPRDDYNETGNLF